MAMLILILVIVAIIVGFLGFFGVPSKFSWSAIGVILLGIALLLMHA